MEAGAVFVLQRTGKAENILYRKDKQTVQQDRYNRQTKGHKRHQRRVRNEKNMDVSAGRGICRRTVSACLHGKQKCITASGNVHF
jgi:hypothetical protein